MFPTKTKPSGISITSISPTLVSLTHSLKRQVRRRGGQRWLIEASYPPLSRADFAPIWAFSIAQQGQFKTFKYIPEIYGSTSGEATDLIRAIGTYAAGDNTISMTASVCSNPLLTDQASCEATNTWTPRPKLMDEYTDLMDTYPDFMDDITMSYTCSNPLLTDQASCEATNTWTPNVVELKAGDFIKFGGHEKVYMLTQATDATLNIEPALIADVANGEAIIYNDVPFNVAFASDITNMSVATNNYVSYSLKLVEIV